MLRYMYRLLVNLEDGKKGTTCFTADSIQAASLRASGMVTNIERNYGSTILSYVLELVRENKIIPFGGA